jgi:hypothetical protein
MRARLLSLFSLLLPLTREPAFDCASLCIGDLWAAIERTEEGDYLVWWEHADSDVEEDHVEAVGDTPREAIERLLQGVADA